MRKFRTKPANAGMAIVYTFWGVGLALRISPELSLVAFLHNLYPWMSGLVIYLLLVLSFLLAAIFFIFVDTRNPRILAIGFVPLIFYAISTLAWFLFDPRVCGGTWMLPFGLVVMFAFGIFHQAAYIEDDDDATIARPQ